MEIHVWSPYRVLPKDLLRTRISWSAHDLDKTINAQIDVGRFKSIGDNEARILTSVLQEWEKREYDDDEIIKWARNVIKEYHLMVKDGIEHNRIDIPTYKFNPPQILELIKTRRSVRRWEEKAIPVDMIKQILEAASWAPSACNRQSCRYIVLQSQAQKQLLVNLREEWLKYAPVIIFVGTEKRNYLPEELDYVPYMDASMAAQNMLLMAHAMGLGAVIVKTAGWDINLARSKGYSQKINAMNFGLNLPSYFIPVLLIAVGYPARFPKTPARLPIDEVVFNEKYGSVDEDISSMEYFKGTKNRLKRLLIEILKRLAKRCGISAYFSIQ